MYLILKHRHLILSLCLGILTLPLSSSPSPDNPRIFIKTQDMVNCRRILLQFTETVEVSEIRKPQIRSDPQAGVFEIILPDFNSARYFGLRRIAEKGVHPINLKVNSTGDEYLAIIGKALPYYSIEVSYAFNQDAYLFDIFWEKQPESAFFEYSVPGTTSDDQNVTPPEHQAISLRKYPWSFDQHTVTQALLIAAAVFIGLIILFVFLKLNRSASIRTYPIKGKDLKVLQSPVQVNNPASATPQFDEAVIRSLSEKRGISYDEAALLILNAEKSK